MRLLLLFLVACYLLTAAPALPKRHKRAPDQPLTVVIDAGATLPDTGKMDALGPRAAAGVS